jgi:hypothetical protein
MMVKRNRNSSVIAITKWLTFCCCLIFNRFLYSSQTHVRVVAIQTYIRLITAYLEVDDDDDDKIMYFKRAH